MKNSPHETVSARAERQSRIERYVTDYDARGLAVLLVQLEDAYEPHAVRKDEPVFLTLAQRRGLARIDANSGDGWRGVRSNTITSLCRLGLIRQECGFDYWLLTEKGREALRIPNIFDEEASGAK